MSFITNTAKRTLLRANILLGTLERLGVLNITKDDMVRWRGPGYRQPIQFGQGANDRIAQRLALGEPLLVARLGSVELACLRFYLEKRKDKGRPYPKKLSASMANPAGFFPVDNRSLDAFCGLFLEQVAQVDVMGVWFNKYEDAVCNRFCPQAELVDFDCLEPFRFAPPWSRALAGKKVLVVHPFVDSIRTQYRDKRRLLFPSPDVLPEFELKTIKSVQSAAGSPLPFATWFDALNHMCDQIAREDFDVCIVGAGAYGLPLASFAKQLGKQAIHLGGVTQILFGIKGKRWETDPAYLNTTAKLFNEHWVRPLDSETPPDKSKIEGGGYW
jgi:hypothetical protein